MKPGDAEPPSRGVVMIAPVVRVAVAVLAAICVLLSTLLYRSIGEVADLSSDAHATVSVELAQHLQVIDVLQQLRRAGSLAYHVEDHTVRSGQIDLAERLARSPNFEGDPALRRRVLNAASAIRGIGERMQLARELQGRPAESTRVRRLRDDARTRWREVDDVLEADVRHLASVSQRSMNERMAEIRNAADSGRVTSWSVVALMLLALVASSILALRVLLRPLLLTARAVINVDARSRVEPLPSSRVIEIDTLYRAVERHADALRQADALAWRSVAVDASTNAVMITDTRGLIEYVNPAFTTVTGYTRDEALGNTPRLLKSGAHIQSFYESFWKTILAGQEWRGELVNRRRDGSLFNDLVTVSPVLDEQGRVVRFIAIHYDITRRKETERQLRSRTADLQQYRSMREADDALARTVMALQLREENLASLGVTAWQIAAAQFSGDVVVAHRAPDGRIFVLFGDATGHGLSAAITVLPILTRFEDMVMQGQNLLQVVAAIDRGMRTMMPVGRFVAATVLAIDRQRGMVEAWMGGMPGMIVLGAAGEPPLGRFRSRDIALGVGERNEEDLVIETLSCPPGSQIALYSDGLIEAEDAEGHALAVSTIEAVLQRNAPETRLAAMRSNFLLHMDGALPHDDVSFVLIDAGPPVRHMAMLT